MFLPVANGSGNSTLEGTEKAILKSTLSSMWNLFVIWPSLSDIVSIKIAELLIFMPSQKDYGYVRVTT